MAQNDTLLYAGLGIGAAYLLYKLGKPVADTGSAIATTTQNTSDALAPWLKNLEMIGRLPELFAKYAKGNTYLTVQQAEAMSPTTAQITTQAKQNAPANRALLEKAAANFNMDKAKKDVETQKTWFSNTGATKSNVLTVYKDTTPIKSAVNMKIPLKKVDLYKTNTQQSTVSKPSIFMK